MQLTDRDVALVTGGASGLGAATVRSLVGSGTHVVVLDLPSSDGAALASELGPAATFTAADVRDEDQVERALEVAVGHGVLRTVVCCAGVGSPRRILGKRGVLPLADFQRIIDINLVGTFNVVRLAARVMAENEPVDGDRGVMVMTASVAAFDGQIGQAAYAASKGGIVALTLTAARDLADHAIRVMTIAPGVMATPMMADLPEAARTSLEALVPHPPRLGRPEEYAQLVRAIIANPLLNGEVIRLDGALRMPPR